MDVMSMECSDNFYSVCERLKNAHDNGLKSRALRVLLQKKDAAEDFLLEKG